MSNFSRRQFVTIAAGSVAAAGMVSFPFLAATASKKVVIIGAGAGGAIAAKYIRMADPTIDVTLIEQNPYYYTCFMSNEVLSGERTIDSIKFSYKGLNKYGINIIYNRAMEIDPVAKIVSLSGGEKVVFDKLIVSPGIEFKWDAIDGYNAEVAETIPHAWKAGSQTVTLRKQLEEMKDGGTVIISAPPKPFRCPPGPYERASQIANYFKHHKPKSKILLFDANHTFSKQNLFIQGWEKMYGYGTDNSMIEWIPSNEEAKVIGVNVKTNAVIVGEFEDQYSADVLNIIPPQTAGKIAIDSGLTNESGWCPVNQKTFESSLHKDIHVIGDACIAAPMPKSAYAANIQAKVCAEAIVSELQGREMATPSYLNACYSIVGDDFGISVAAIYRLENGKIVSVKDSGGISALDASAETRKHEVAYAHSWFNNITYEMFN